LLSGSATEVSTAVSSMDCFCRVGCQMTKTAASRKDAEAARLEARADEILERDEQLLHELGQHAAALQECYRELLAPRIDPAYVRTLESHEEDRTRVANVTRGVHHVVDGGRSWLSIV